MPCEDESSTLILYYTRLYTFIVKEKVLAVEDSTLAFGSCYVMHSSYNNFVARTSKHYFKHKNNYTMLIDNVCHYIHRYIFFLIDIIL